MEKSSIWSQGRGVGGSSDVRRAWVKGGHTGPPRTRGYSKRFFKLIRDPGRNSLHSHFSYVRRRLWRPDSRCCDGVGHNPPDKLVTNHRHNVAQITEHQELQD